MTASDDPLADLARLEGVPSALAAALAAVDGVLRDRGMRKVEVADVAAAAWTSARAAVHLVDEPGADPERAAAAMVRMYAEVPAVADLVRTAPAQALARLHTVWGRGLVPDTDLGVVRSDPETAERLQALQRLLTEPTGAPALLLAGVVHAEVWTLAPFRQGSWAVALGMEQAVVMATGVDPSGVIPLAAGHQAIGGHHAAVAGAVNGSVAGVRVWLEFEAAAVTRAAELCPLAVRS